MKAIRYALVTARPVPQDSPRPEPKPLLEQALAQAEETAAWDPSNATRTRRLPRWRAALVEIAAVSAFVFTLDLTGTRPCEMNRPSRAQTELLEEPLHQRGHLPFSWLLEHGEAHVDSNASQARIRQELRRLYNGAFVAFEIALDRIREQVGLACDPRIPTTPMAFVDVSATV